MTMFFENQVIRSLVICKPKGLLNMKNFILENMAATRSRQHKSEAKNEHIEKNVGQKHEQQNRCCQCVAVIFLRF